MTRWAILTGEYPPQPGGVSDHTRQVAGGLVAAGDRVCVYAPPWPDGEAADNGAVVRRLPDHFGRRGLAALDRALALRPRPDRLLVQYVPHAFGLKAMNLPFAAWIAARASRIAPVWVMFHEVAFPFVRRPLHHNLIAAVNRLMVRLLAGAADRILVSIPGWAPLLRAACPGAKPAEWLPIVSNIVMQADASAVMRIRGAFCPPGSLLVGHFGTYGALITEMLEPVVARLLTAAQYVRLLLIGRGSREFSMRLTRRFPALAERVTATGGLAEAQVAGHLRACDFLLQPYPDGVSSRRGSVMAGLASGVPVATNLGALSERLWATAPGVRIALTPNPAEIAAVALELLQLTPAMRAALGGHAAQFYRDSFSVELTIARLRAA
jgi:glycosyltransferase involved in cell wall biosynthesis